MDKISIVYECKCGAFVPINVLFYNEVLNKLVCRSSSCAMEEFEAYYCGYLLVNMPSKEANLYQNKSSRCFLCRTCETILSTAFDEISHKYFFFCGHCRWDSFSIGLMEEDPDMLMMTAVAHERESMHEMIYHTLLSHYTSFPSIHNSSTRSKVYTLQRMRSSLGSSQFFSTDSFVDIKANNVGKKSKYQRLADMGPWKYENLVGKMTERDDWLQQQKKVYGWEDLQRDIIKKHSIPSDKEREEQERVALENLAATTNLNNISTLHQRLQNPLEQQIQMDQMYPTRPLLRVKRTWRCVESINQGAPGILVKPQISPMSGDSSLPIPTPWFKKASLAIHYIPIITFQELPTRKEQENPTNLTCTLLIENPCDYHIQMIIKPMNEDASSENAQFSDSSMKCTARAVIEDLTPLILGPSEDPNFVDLDSHVDDPGASAAESTKQSHTPNKMMLSNVYNIMKLRLPIQMSKSSSIVSFMTRIEINKYDEETKVALPDSNISFNVVFSSPNSQFEE